MAKIFFAFPHRFDQEHPNYRVALRQACEDLRHEAVFASAVPTAGHVLQHVNECIDGCDAAFFDVTGLNPSVLIELGMAYAEGKPTFVLLNQNEHVKFSKTFLGKQSAEPMEIPADLSGIIRTHYTSTFDLRQSLKRTLEQYFPSKPEVLPLAKSIVQHLKRFGPLPMTGIATGVAADVNQVRPVVWSLVATAQLKRTGAGPGTKYELS
jgi:nucleoside 2-deoxyribosyltransferase